jgi:xanthine dehydrogenase accessory factor
MLDGHNQIPIIVESFEAVLSALPWTTLVDARMRKRSVPEPQRGLIPITIGLGPNFIAGETVDLAIESSWDRLGAVVRRGPTMPLAGEPRMIFGVGRERFVHAPCAGIFRTDARIGDLVLAGAVVGTIGNTSIAGALRGLTHDGVRVAEGTKVLAIDPRGDRAILSGLGERPRRIAEAVLMIIAGD